MTKPASRAWDRRMGWAGIAFIVLLMTSGLMVTLPTRAMDGAQIATFYAAHRELILLQQGLGALALVPFLAFAVALARQPRSQPQVIRDWLIGAAVLVAATELITNILPIALAITTQAGEMAHAFTVAEDVADGLLFSAIAVFAVAASLREVWWVRPLGIIIAGLTLSRALSGLVGLSLLDAVAPIAFIAFVVLLSVRMIATPVPTPRMADPGSSAVA